MADPEADDRLVSGLPETADVSFERTLRPRSLVEFVGQERVVERLSIYIEAARGRGEALDHVLLYGPPGLGKTTLAHIAARELQVNLRHTSGPAIERPGDLPAMLTNLEPRDVLFIDEIHRLHRSVEEVLYPAMEDFAVDVIIGSGPDARSLRVELPVFTLVGATTRAGLLTSPLRDRFGVTLRLDFYRADELLEILVRSAALLELEASAKALRELARRSRGTPRVANRLLRRVRDYAQVRADGVLTIEVVGQAMELLGIDDFGMDPLDRRLLYVILHHYDGGPVGLDTLSAAVSEEARTIEDVYEPYLMQIGFLQRTPRGRVTTQRAADYLGGDREELQGRLF